MSGDPREDWLWDGSGEPDELEAELVRKLSPLRHSGAPLPAFEPTDRAARDVANAGRWRRWAVVAAAVGVAAVGLATLLPRRGPAWRYEDDAACAAGCDLAVGRWLETRGATAVLEVADIGWMEVRPGSRLRLVATGDEHRVELEAGSVHAWVDAPPRLLIVDTPSAAAVDLGCAYELTVDARGTLVSVETGRVALEAHAFDVVVPAGASARSTSGAVGVPVFRDAPPAIAALIDEITAARVDDALAVARPRDTLTLFYLLSRTTGDARARVFARIEALSPAAAAADEGAVLRLDEPALENLFERLSAAWEVP